MSEPLPKYPYPWAVPRAVGPALPAVSLGYAPFIIRWTGVCVTLVATGVGRLVSAIFSVAITVLAVRVAIDTIRDALDER